MTISPSKSTGWHSQNSHFHGHCRSIAEQFREREAVVSMEDVSLAIRWELAEMDEWPLKRVWKSLQPAGWREADTVLANKAIEMAHAKAEQEGMWLYEYVDGYAKAQKTWGGAVRSPVGGGNCAGGPL